MTTILSPSCSLAPLKVDRTRCTTHIAWREYTNSNSLRRHYCAKPLTKLNTKILNPPAASARHDSAFPNSEAQIEFHDSFVSELQEEVLTIASILLRRSKSLSETAMAAVNKVNNPSAIVRVDDIKQSALSGEKVKKLAISSWAATPLAIRLPLITFSLFFLVLRVSFGSRAVHDLLPLWIAGPFIMAAIVLITAQLCRVLAAVGREIGIIATECSACCSLLIGYAMSGRAPGDAVTLAKSSVAFVEAKKNEFLMASREKRAEVVLYVESGKMKDDAMRRMEGLAVQTGAVIRKWAVRKYEDTADSWMPVKREISKILQKIF